MPIFDVKCEQCGEVEEVLKAYAAKYKCKKCGGDTKHLVSAPKAFLGFDYRPYDALDRRIPDTKPIKSFANDKRKGGKDTT